MLFPLYNFSDPSLNYSTVQATVKSMVSYINAQSERYRKSTNVASVMTNVNPTLTAMRYDEELTNTERWKNDVRVAYRQLFNLVQ